jgi:hypothetical protein
MKSKEKHKSNLTELKTSIVELQQDLSTVNQQSSTTIENYIGELASKDHHISGRNQEIKRLKEEFYFLEKNKE